MKSKLLIKKASANIALNEEKEFYDPETASSSGMSRVPSEPSRILSPRGMIGVDAWFSHHTQNSMGTSKTFLGMSLPKNDISFITQWSKHFGIFL